jgi:hypothetical protein
MAFNHRIRTIASWLDLEFGTTVSLHAQPSSGIKLSDFNSSSEPS